MRIKIAFTLLALMWILLLTRVYYLSIKSNKYYEQIAEQNSIKSERIAPVRGQILDRNHQPLAVNDLGFSINIKPHIKKDAELNSYIEHIVSVFPELNATQLAKNYRRLDSPYHQDFVPVVEFLDYNKTLTRYAQLELNDAISVRATSKRLYPYGDLASHIIGYIGRANLKDTEEDPTTKLTNYIGRAGIERFYNDDLQGIPGQRRTRVTALNQRVELVEQINPSSSDVMLSIDLELQIFTRSLW